MLHAELNLINCLCYKNLQSLVQIFFLHWLGRLSNVSHCPCWCYHFESLFEVTIFILPNARLTYVAKVCWFFCYCFYDICSLSFVMFSHNASYIKAGYTTLLFYFSLHICISHETTCLLHCRTLINLRICLLIINY